MSWRAWVLVLAVALAASAGSLHNGFVYDDVPIVVEDKRLHEGSLGSVLTEPYWPSSFGDDQLYRPLTSLSFAVDWRLSGGRPFLFHVENVALHLAAVALVLALAALLLPAAGAVVAALWFAVQPVHVEAIANVVGRAELLAAVFYLAAVLVYARSTAPELTRLRRAVAGSLIFLFGLLAAGAKEHALTLPAALLLVDAAIANRHGARFKDHLARHWALWLAGVAAAAAYLLVRAHATDVGMGHGQIAAGLEGKNAAQRFVAMLPAYAAWTRLLLVPLRLSADYAPNALRPDLSLSLAHIAGFGCVGAALALAAWARRRAPAVTFGIAWFVVTASVAANVVVPTGILMAERTLYLPSVGVALAAGAAWLLLPRGRALWPATALVLALLGARTLERVTLWRDNPRFFERLAVDAPDSYRSHWMRGTWEFRRGHFGAGERLYREALAIYPYDASLVGELGMWYLQAHAWEPADRFLTMALRMDSTMSEAAVKAVFARTEAGHADSAAALARVALGRWPRREDVLLVAIRALQRSGANGEAAALGMRLVERDPTRWEYLQIAGDAAARAGDCHGARSLLARARARAPAAEPAPTRLLERIGAGGDCAARL